LYLHVYAVERTGVTSSKEVAYAVMNGLVVAYDTAAVHVDSTAFRYGAMVFEGLRGYWEPGASQMYVVKLADHLARLRDSAKVMRFDSIPADDDLRNAILECIRTNEFRKDVHLRLNLWVDGIGASDNRGPIGWSVTATPRDRRVGQRGITACVSSWTRTSDNSIPPRIKCAANYQNARLSLMQATTDGYDLAILLDRDGHVAESPTSCIFLVRHGTLITPPVYNDILESITRDAMMELAATINVTVVQRPIDRTELYVADEIFVCGTGAEVVPVLSVDRYSIGSGQRGPITAALMRLYFGVVRGLDENPIWRSWLTTVY
jgi:branched-chain amino acid aminotransferase